MKLPDPIATRKRQVIWAHRTLRACALLLLLAWLGLKLVPLPPALSRPPASSWELTDRHGVPLREMRVDDRFTREVALADVPPTFIHAMLAAEDKRFFRHRGIDVAAITRALWNNTRHRRITSGASTITQQLVKISQPWRRTFWIKCCEALQAMRLEQLWSKEQILSAYLNRLDFGNMNIGVAAAAEYYFGKPLADLSEAEAAFIAGLPKNPTRLNPHRAFRAAKRRQETVLRRMEESAWITTGQRARAQAEALHLRAPQRLFRAPHFVDLVLRALPRAEKAHITTTLDLDLNRFTEGVVREQLARLHGKNVQDAAVVVLDNSSGDVLALVGSQDYFAPGSGQVNGAWAPRSAGSTFKPFTYLLALERGATPASVVADVPAVFPTRTGIFRPENYNQRCYGPLRYRLALANSLNIPAVRVLASIGGAGTLQERLRGWGMTTLEKSRDYFGLGLTIGNGETRLLELANAYATLARLGEWQPYRLVREPVSLNAQPQPPRLQLPLETPLAAWLVADMLSDASARAISFGLQSALRFNFPVACKTGTSSDYRDNWAVGYTPEFTVAVWAGNFDGSPMRDVSGVTGAAPIMHVVMEHLHRQFGTSWYLRPSQIVEREVHPVTGHLLAKSTPGAVRERFIASMLPPLESAADYDPSGCVALGPEYAEWSKSAQNGLSTRTIVAPSAGELQLIFPIPGTTFLVDPDLPSSSRVVLRVHGGSAVKWQSDSLEVRAEGGRTFAVAKEGDHRLTAQDTATGQTAETWIRVKQL